MNKPDLIRPRARPRNRAFAIAKAVFGCWAGTEEIVKQLQEESVQAPGWRPLRAAALHGVADQAARVWMSTEEFRSWREREIAMAKRAGLSAPEVEEAVGLTRGRAVNILSNGIAVRKVTALACAHYSMRLPMPVESGDFGALQRWFSDRFRQAQPVYAWLELDQDHFTDRLRGYAVIKGERITRPFDDGLVRALDWLDRVGPVCPFGDHRQVDVFPKGE